MHAMRMGPGKHLKGRVLMNGLVKPEEFDYFHEVHNKCGKTILFVTEQSLAYNHTRVDTMQPSRLWRW